MEKSYREYYEEIFHPWLSIDFEDSEEPFCPRKIKNPGILAKIAVEYFIERAESNQPITYLGLILKAGLHSRSALDNYLEYSEEFKGLINTIKLLIEETIVQGLYNPVYFKASNFLLKTNYKYSETIHQIIENKEFHIDIKKPEEED